MYILLLGQNCAEERWAKNSVFADKFRQEEEKEERSKKKTSKEPQVQSPFWNPSKLQTKNHLLQGSIEICSVILLRPDEIGRTQNPSKPLVLFLLFSNLVIDNDKNNGCFKN